MRSGVRAVVVLSLALLASACRQDMQDQAKLEPLEASVLFADGAASRAPVPGTVARGLLHEDDALYRGVGVNGELLSDLPMPLTAELLETGRGRFDAFCSPCHDRLGEGRGMIVRRGFKQPHSFHEERLREAAAGYFFNVMTNGFGQMSSYADKLTAEERWAVVAYIRALQLSQAVSRDVLSPEDLAALARGGAQPQERPADGPGEEHAGGH